MSLVVFHIQRLLSTVWFGTCKKLVYIEKDLVLIVPEMDRVIALNKKLGVSEFPTSKELMIKAIQSEISKEVAQEYWNILQELMQEAPLSNLTTSPVTVVEPNVDELKKNAVNKL